MSGSGNSRRVAAFIILRWMTTHEFPSNMLPNGPDRAFVQDLVYTTIRRLRSLRLILGKLVPHWPKGELEALLYVGAAQILHMNNVPDFAAVDETVSAAKLCQNKNIARVVNGVLRNLIRRRCEWEELMKSSPIEVRESFPTELVRRWTNRFGDKDTERLCSWFNTPAETFLARSDGSFTSLERGKSVMSVAGYDSGEFIVQDPATAFAIRLMDVQKNDSVLDACAAPGGKTIQLAWRGALVTACEVNPKRRHRLIDNLVRVGCTDSVKVISSIDSSLGFFPKILVDAPCSNTGVLRRRPDARWNWTVEKLSSLVNLQAEILDSVASLLSVGGTMVYSTCSLEPEENVVQVESFLKRHPQFELVEVAESIPFMTGHDGAFAASIRRRIE